MEIIGGAEAIKRLGSVLKKRFVLITDPPTDRMQRALDELHRQDVIKPRIN